MPLYIADYLADTAHLGALESGAYLHLIMHYWQTGGLPDDPRELARIAKVSAHSWKKLSPALQKFFHDGWKHKRVDAELLKASDISEKRSAAARARHAAGDANAPANAEHLDTQSQPQSQKKETPSLRSGDAPAAAVDKPKVSRGTRLPPDWIPSEADQQFAVDNLGSIETAREEFAKFRDHWNAQPGTKGVKTDWPGTWRNWCRNALRFSGRGPPQRHKTFEEIAEELRGTHETTNHADAFDDASRGGEFDFGGGVSAGR